MKEQKICCLFIFHLETVVKKKYYYLRFERNASRLPAGGRSAGANKNNNVVFVRKKIRRR